MNEGATIIIFCNINTKAHRIKVNRIQARRTKVNRTKMQETEAARQKRNRIG